MKHAKKHTFLTDAMASFINSGGEMISILKMKTSMLKIIWLVVVVEIIYSYMSNENEKTNIFKWVDANSILKMWLLVYWRWENKNLKMIRQVRCDDKHGGYDKKGYFAV